MDSKLVSSIAKLFLACVGLAFCSIMFSMFLDRITAPDRIIYRPTQEMTQATFQDAIHLDRQMSSLHEELFREQGQSLRFPVEIEEAMLGEGLQSDHLIP